MANHPLSLYSSLSLCCEANCRVALAFGFAEEWDDLLLLCWFVYTLLSCSRPQWLYCWLTCIVPSLSHECSVYLSHEWSVSHECSLSLFYGLLSYSRSSYFLLWRWRQYGLIVLSLPFDRFLFCSLAMFRARSLQFLVFGLTCLYYFLYMTRICAY
jgi:hypothetical protein